MDQENVTCPKCEREIDDSLTWCPFCGTELDPGAAEARRKDSAAAVAAAVDGDDGQADPFAPTAAREPLPADSIPQMSTTDSTIDDGTPGGRSPAVMVAIGVALLALIGAGAAFFFLSSDDTGDLGVTRMSVGDCWDDPDLALEITELTDVPQVPCDEPHANEVFAIADLPAGSSAAYPGEFEVYFEGFLMCLDRFEGYVGIPFGQSPLDIYTLYPVATGWAAGDREVVCSLYLLDETPLVSTERDSTRRLATPAPDVSGISDCTGLVEPTLDLVQGFIDYVDDTTDDLDPLIKGETLIIARAGSLGCDFEELNVMVVARVGNLTYTTDLGRSVAEDVIETGFFPTG